MSGKGNGAGFDYEIRIGGLVALRLCNKPNIQDFKLTINHGEVEKVDDIIFSYKVFEENPVTVYVQLKQNSKVKKICRPAFEVNREENETLKKDGFSLFKYYKAFKDVKTNDPIWDDVDRNREMFIVYTTAKIDPDELKSVKMVTEGHVTTVDVVLKSDDVPLYQKILSTGKEGEVYKYSVTSEEKGLEENKFFENSLLFVKQSSVGRSFYLIQECIQTLLGDRSDFNKLESTVSNYIEYIKYRQASTKKKPFTKEEIISQLIWIYTKSLHISPNSTFKLADNDVEAWNDLISNKRIIVVEEYKADYVDVLQFCIEINIKQNKKKYLCLNLEHLYLDDENFFKYLSEMRQFLKNDSYQTLILISEHGVNAQQKQFLINVVNVFESNQLRKLVIVSKNIDDIVSNISAKVEKLCSLSDLDDDNHLMQELITYYGHPIKLGNFVGKYPEVKKYFKTHHLLDLFYPRRNEAGLSNLNIGTPLCYDLNFNIKRKATIYALKPTILECKEMKNYVVCIAGNVDKSDLDCESYVEAKSVTNESALNNCHFVILPDSDSVLSHLENYRKLKDKYSKFEFILVLVGKKYNNRIWRIVVASDAAKQFLNKFIFKRNIPLKVKDDITILTGEPGMGKSTLCQHIWRKNVRNSAPTLNITHTDLENVRNLKELLEYSLRNADDLTRKIFDYHCYNNNVLFILDAFDELDETARINALQVIEDCVDKNYSMLITTRPFAASAVENKTNINSQRLSAFCKEQQILFLKKYWMKTLNLSGSSDKINEFVIRLLEVVHESVNDKERLITGVPLQCRMLGEIYEQQCKAYIETSEALDELLPKKLNIVDMYEKCVDKKFEILRSDKMRSEREIFKNGIVKLCMKSCQIYGLITIFKNYAKKYETFMTEAQRDDIELLISSGIFTTFEERLIENKKVYFPIFVHRTYAEYFAALFLSEAEHWKSENELFNLILSSREYDTVRYFFDSIVAKDRPLITATIRNDKKQIENEIANINERDVCGRSALHLVAMWGVRLTDLDRKGKYSVYNNDEICRLLLENKIDVDCEDDINKWKPIRYGDNIRALHIINELIKHSSVNDRDVPFLINDLESDVYIRHDSFQNMYDGSFRGNSLIHSISSWGLTEVLRYLLSKEKVTKLFEDILVNNLKQTPLHLAVNKRHVDIVRLLLTIPSIIHVADKGNENRILHYCAIKGFVDIMELLLDNDQVQGDIDCGNRYGETALHLAAKEGHVDVFKLLLDAGAKSSIVDEFGSSVLHYAAGGGNAKIVDLLLKDEKIKLNINSLTLKKDTALHLAVKSGSIDTIEVLLDAGATIHDVDEIYGNTPLLTALESDYMEIAKRLLSNSQIKEIVNVANKFKITALHVAASNDDNYIVDRLIEIGANVNAIDENGDTPLATAVQYSSLAVIEYLLKVGADTSTVNKFGFTILHCAADGGNAKIVDLLLKDEKIKLNINSLTLKKDTALHLAVKKSFFDTFKVILAAGATMVDVDERFGNTQLLTAFYRNNMEIVRLLLNNSQSKEIVNIANKNKDTALHVAASKDDIDIVDRLIEIGANVNAVDIFDLTPLHSAVWNNNFDIVDKLAAAGANVNATNKIGNTPLATAVQCSSLAVIEYLLNSGADTSTVNKFGFTILHCAADGGNAEIVDLLLKDEKIKLNINSLTLKKDTALHLAVKKSFFDTVKVILAAGATMVDVDERFGNTQLLTAFYRNNMEIVRLLLNNSQSKEIVNIANKNKDTALHVAVRENHIDIVDRLIAVGANVNATDKGGNTPLHMAVRFNYINIVDRLIAVGANVNATDKGGNTPLHMAVGFNYINIVDRLIAVGANVNATNVDGNTPIFHANPQKAVAQLLLKAGAKLDIVNMCDVLNCTALQLCN